MGGAKRGRVKLTRGGEPLYGEEGSTGDWIVMAFTSIFTSRWTRLDRMFGGG